MASSNRTTCPKCGGEAYWNTDDGITYCDAKPWKDAKGKLHKCGYMDVEDSRSDYRPPDYRGG